MHTSESWVFDDQNEIRMLHFIRHGTYHIPKGSKDSEGILTTRGIKQAKQLATYMAKIPLQAIHCSDFSRALETASIVGTHFPRIKIKRTRILRELTATGFPGCHVPLKKRAQGQEQLDRITELYFRPSRRMRHEALICHGTLIRTLLCKVQGVPLSMWHRFYGAVFNCSITSFAVHTCGRARLIKFNEVGHLDEDLVTYY